MKIYTIWPATKGGEPASSAQAWRQTTRWLVLDVTRGLDQAVVMALGSRAECLAEELRLRITQRATNNKGHTP